MIFFAVNKGLSLTYVTEDEGAVIFGTDFFPMILMNNDKSSSFFILKTA